MPQDIHELFDPYRGDLLYGFAADRDEFYNHINNTAPNDCDVNLFFGEGNDTAWITVDLYNDTLFGNQTLFQGGTARLKENIDAVQPGWIKDFWDNLSAHRFSPLEAFTTPYEKRTKEGWTDLSKDRYYLAIRRGCKFGIEHILNVASPDAKIHFLLDRFERNQGERMVAAVYKMASDARGRTSVSITYSEIRYIYRNWNRLHDRILFYYNFEKADFAPWEDTTRQAVWNDLATGQHHACSYRDLWTTYGDTRKNKYLTMLNNGKIKYAAEYGTHKVRVDQLAGEAALLNDAGQQAKYEQALTLLQPDRNKWKELQV